MPFNSVLERPRRYPRAAVLHSVAAVRGAEPRIRYARTSDGVDIAYSAVGSGEPLVILSGSGGLSHLAREWQYPEQRAWLERIAANRRVIRIDHRGSGLSDRDAAFDLAAAAWDVEAVIEKEGLPRVALLGQLHTAGAAITYAARHPERVTHVALWSPFTNYQEFLDSSAPLKAARAVAEADWVTYTEVIAQLALGWTDMAQARRFAAYLRECVHDEQYVQAMRQFVAFDATAQLQSLRMPVLVLHRREAIFPSIELVSRIAAEVPSGRLALLPGAGSLPFLGDVDSVVAALSDFLSTPNVGREAGGLTERETQILALLAEGHSNKGIARALSISTRTVERHIGNVYTKIGAHNRAQATAYAFRHDIAISEPPST